eukprot:s1631_g8.t1
MFHLIFVILVLFLPKVDSEVVEVAIRKCVPGMPCTAQVSSSSYTAEVPRLMVVREDHACGAPPDSQFKAAENPAGGTAAVGNTSFFDFGIAGPSPGLFRLCLCTVNCKPWQIVNPLAFNEDVGDLLVSGPLEAKQMPAFCIAGGPSCIVNITAIGAHPGLTPVQHGAAAMMATAMMVAAMMITAMMVTTMMVTAVVATVMLVTTIIMVTAMMVTALMVMAMMVTAMVVTAMMAFASQNVTRKMDGEGLPRNGSGPNCVLSGSEGDPVELLPPLVIPK